MIDELFNRFEVSQNSVLFGAVPPEMYPLLQAGLEEMPFGERETFIEAVLKAQAVLRDHAMRAVFASGRAQYLAPNNVSGLLDYKQHRIRIKEAA